MVQKRTEGRLQTLIKEEIQSMMEEANERSEEIGKKLEEMRKRLVREGKITEDMLGSGNVTTPSRSERRIPLESVSKVIDIPVNELTLHFLNGHRIREGKDLVEYRLGCVYFYGEDD